jgi:hypothetical protein
MENLDKGIEASKSLREKYLSKADSSGYIDIGEFATQELRRQSKNVASFLDGDEGSNNDVNLGEGIRFTGTSGNYSDMKVHIEDLDEFVRRVKEYYGE